MSETEPPVYQSRPYSCLKSEMHFPKQEDAERYHVLAMQCDAIQAPVMQMRNLDEQCEEQRERGREGEETGRATAHLSQDHSCQSS
jgi:hypothetical protein